MFTAPGCRREGTCQHGAKVGVVEEQAGIGTFAGRQDGRNTGWESGIEERRGRTEEGGLGP